VPPPDAVRAIFRSRNVRDEDKKTVSAVQDLGSVESIRIEGGSQSRRLERADRTPAWITDGGGEVANAGKTPDAVPDAAGADNAEADGGNISAGVEAEGVFNSPASANASPHHGEEVPTTSNSPDTVEAGPSGTDVIVPPNAETVGDPAAAVVENADPELEERNQVAQTPAEEQPEQVPAENDSGVNVEDVHNEEIDHQPANDDVTTSKPRVTTTAGQRCKWVIFRDS